jgi:mono/diheme cytochrome c family protein
MRKRLWMTLILGLMLIAGTAWTLRVYLSHGLSARDTPLPIEAFVARRLRHLAIPREARRIRNPVPLTADVLAEGRAHFADHCATCHANDGSGKTEMGQNFYPKVPDMRLLETQRLSDGELFYIIQNGVRFTGMPAWGTGSRDHEEASWHLVHFIRHLPQITPEEIENMRKMNPRSAEDWREEEEEESFLRGEETSRTPTEHKH